MKKVTKDKCRHWKKMSKGKKKKKGKRREDRQIDVYGYLFLLKQIFWFDWSFNFIAIFSKLQSEFLGDEIKDWVEVNKKHREIEQV